MSAVLAASPARRATSGAAVALPGWPVLALLWGFPVFWVLGLVVIGPAILAMVMGAYLMRSRGLLIVPGIPAFAAFLLWIVPTAVMIDSAPRMLGFGFRLTVLLIVGMTLLYSINAHRSLTRKDLVTGLTFVWLFVIAGGYLGLMFPEVRLSTPVGIVLPSSIGSNDYVHDLFFPPFAEIQSPYGAPTPFLRPSAPFPYANSWGVAIVLLTPVALARFLMSPSWRVRLFLLAALGAMLVPAMATSNRGMFAAFALGALYVTLRMTLRNRAAPVLSIVGLGIVGIAVLIASGVPQRIAERQLYSQTTEGRSALYVETFQRTLASPLLGYGAPRPSLTHEVSVGTQGYIWSLMFSFGFVGLALFLWFLLATTWRTRRAADDVDVVLHSVLVMTCFLITVYSLDIMQMLTVILVAALLLRARYLPDSVP